MISASVVLYNTKLDDLRKIITCYSPNSQKLLFLIDNSPISMDHVTLKSLGDNIEYIYNNANLGYGTAHNIGINKAIENGASKVVVCEDIKCSVPKEVVEDTSKWLTDYVSDHYSKEHIYDTTLHI